MPINVVLGLQWGDEGKGKIVDYYSRDVELILRATGGNNAGHTVVIDKTTYKLHLVPSGLFENNKIGILGNGTVLDLAVLCKELNDLKQRNNGSVVFVSGKAHVIMPWHKHFDVSTEAKSGDKKIGTTGRGIGPAYESKANRSTAIRIYDLTTKERFAKRVTEVFQLLKPRLQETAFDKNVESILSEMEPFRLQIAPLVIDSVAFTRSFIDQDKLILVEGAQGALLDFDHGTFPFVTSSNPTIGGIFTGTGVSHKHVKQVIGVTKAYCTRVGAGPFPTKLVDADGEYLQVNGNEFGTTTGRKRDCGWIDLVALRYACQLNGVTEIALTKLDVLSGLKIIKAAVAYKSPNGETTSVFPEDTNVLSSVEPIYREFPGWSEKLEPNFETLPNNAKQFINAIEKYTNTPIALVSTGPERKQTITRTNHLV